MRCKCGSRMKVIDVVYNPVDIEKYRKLKCSKCGNIIHTCECEIEYSSIRDVYNKYYRDKGENKKWQNNH